MPIIEAPVPLLVFSCRISASAERHPPMVDNCAGELEFSGSMDANSGDVNTTAQRKPYLTVIISSRCLMQSACRTQLLLQSTTTNLPVQVNAVWYHIV